MQSKIETIEKLADGNIRVVVELIIHPNELHVPEGHARAFIFDRFGRDLTPPEPRE